MSDSSRFVPGTFGCHEALHMASVLMEMVEEKLCEHPAIEMHPLWVSLANRARENLFKLYQEIGSVHLQTSESYPGENGEYAPSAEEMDEPKPVIP